MKTALATLAAFLVSIIFTSTSFALTPLPKSGGFAYYIMQLIEFILGILLGGPYR